MISQQPTAYAVPRTAIIGGIVMMALGIFLFAVNDALGKWMLATYSIGQLLLIRSIAAAALLAPFVLRGGKTGLVSLTRLPRPGLQLLRMVFSTGEVVLFYWALSHLPLADVMTYYLAGPIYVTAISATLLSEPVGWRRWCAVIVGFGGVLLVLQPSATTLTLPALVAIAGSLCFSLLMICTRLVRGTGDLALVGTQTAGTLLFGAIAAPFAWVTPEPGDFGLLMLLGVVAMSAHACVNRALKLAPTSIVVPYQYTMIVWAIVLGYWVFGDVPSLTMLAGAAIIIAAGIYIFARERRFAHPPFPAAPD